MYCEVFVPLLLGFALDAASAFTTAFSRRWGKAGGERACFVLRNVLGIPLWVVGLGFAVRSPSPPLFEASTTGTVIGWVLLLAGATLQTFAILELRMRAARPSVDDRLAAGSVYARLRHPIYAGLLLEFAGIVLVKPRRIVLAAAAFGCAWVYLQARLEESDLLQRMPAYRDYMTRVPRFLPRVPGARRR
jgi:protein-S-isoprenylcysteine O-methyltransferase Ste14